MKGMTPDILVKLGIPMKKQPPAMTMQDEFDHLYYTAEFDDADGDLGHIDPDKVKAFIGRAEKVSNAKAQIEAYDNVRRLAHGTSHTHYAEEQIAKLKEQLHEHNG